MFNNTWLFIYPRPRRLVLDNGSEFKRGFIPILKDFDIKPVCTTDENPQGNVPIEQVHQVIHNMVATKDTKKRTFDYIYPWEEIPTSVSWAIRSPYHSTFYASPSQLVFGRDIIFNLTSFIDWRVIRSRKQEQLDRENIRENKKSIFYDYAVGNQVFVKTKGIIGNMDTPKRGIHTITYLFTNRNTIIQNGSNQRTYKHIPP